MFQMLSQNVEHYTVKKYKGLVYLLYGVVSLFLCYLTRHFGHFRNAWTSWWIFFSLVTMVWGIHRFTHNAFIVRDIMRIGTPTWWYEISQYDDKNNPNS